MITFDTYITILFSIIIAALLGSIITIAIQNLPSTKRKLMFVTVFLITFVLIITATLIYFFDKHTISIFSLSLSMPKLFDTLHLPFCKTEFSNKLFRKIYYLNVFIYLICKIILIIILYMKGKSRQKKYKNKKILPIRTKYSLILTSFISVYPYIWGNYVINNFLFNNISIWSIYFLQVILTLLFLLVEFALFFCIIGLILEIQIRLHQETD